MIVFFGDEKQWIVKYEGVKEVVQGFERLTRMHACKQIKHVFHHVEYIAPLVVILYYSKRIHLAIKEFVDRRNQLKVQQLRQRYEH